MSDPQAPDPGQQQPPPYPPGQYPEAQYPPPPPQYPPGQFPPAPYPPAPSQPGQYPPPYPTYGPPAPAEPYAHWGQRVAAFLLDLAMMIPGYAVIFIGTGLMGSSVTTYPDGTGRVTDTPSLITGIVLVGVAGLATFIFSIWNQIVRQGRRGASLGKQIMGILVISEEDGRPIGALLTFVRSMVHILDSLSCYVGYLWPLWDPKRQTFADKIMKTAVLHLPDVRF